MKIPFLITLLVSGSLSIASLSAQQNQVPPASSAIEKVNRDPERTKKINSINNAFSNLLQKDREEYYALKKDAYTYFNNKRTFAALMKIQEMLNIFDADPQAHMLLGSIHMEFRNFDKARSIYNKIKELSNYDNNLRFNIAEVEFCTSNWKQSLEQFLELKKIIKNTPHKALAKLIELKIILCHLALSEASTGSEKEKHHEDAEALANQASYLKDSPYYYYAKAALAFHSGDKKAASQWINTVKIVYSTTPQALSSWNDTFIEFGYIDSHYGKDEIPKSEDSIQLK